jgi:membrane-associated protein
VDVLLHDLVPWIVQHGTWVILVVVAAETACFLGLLVPAEAIVLLGGFLASQGHFPVTDVLLATCVGAFAGDNLGYALGRRWGTRVGAHTGVLGRLWRRYERRATTLFRRRSLYAVTLARFISFVRTLMPWFAGMARLPYGRFVIHDLVGVVGWGVASVAAGYLAGASWQIVAGTLGTASAVVIFLILLATAVAALRQRRVARRLENALAGAEPDYSGRDD